MNLSTLDVNPLPIEVTSSKGPRGNPVLQVAKQNIGKHHILGLSLPEWGILSLFSATALITLRFHESWADEAQAWLIARDLPFTKMLLQVKYEGSPPLWHILLWLLIRCHLSYAHIGFVSTAIMVAAIYLWLRYAPLPAWVRFLAPFTFFIQYQYAVVARSYCLTTLLAFAVVAVWRSEKRSFLLLGILLALMCQTNLYGFALAGSLTAFCWLELFQNRHATAPKGRVAFWIATVMIIISACSAAWLADPPPDSLPNAMGSLMRAPVNYWWSIFCIHSKLALEATFGSTYLSAILLVALAAWLGDIKRRLSILPFLCTLIVLGSLYFRVWHLGMLLVGLLVSVWLAWPEQSPRDRIWTHVFSTVLLIIFLIQIRWTIVSVRNEIRGPYSGAEATANYLRQQDGLRNLYGAHYHDVGISAYFDHNLFINRSHTYWEWSVNDTSDSSLLMKEFTVPSTVVLGWDFKKDRNEDPLPSVLRAQHFRLTHTFCGHLFMRDTYSELNCYDIYENAFPHDAGENSMTSPLFSQSASRSTF